MRQGATKGEIKVSRGSKRSRWWVLILVAVLALGCVLGFGLLYSNREARRPIALVRDYRPTGVERTVGERIDDFLVSKGVEASDAFQPRWGAELIAGEGGSLFTVSYTYEEDRSAESLSWEVDVDTKRIRPRDAWARELLSP